MTPTTIATPREEEPERCKGKRTKQQKIEIMKTTGRNLKWEQNHIKIMEIIKIYDGVKNR